MGCTSAKPKRTTSIEDVPGGGKQPHPANQVPDKNGQVNKTAADKAPAEKILREKTNETSNAIEIPGAHKSFMAPDGIPFIDEDVESEADDGAGANQVLSNDSWSAKQQQQHSSPDQNKNVAAVANKEGKQPASSHSVAPAAPQAAARSSALSKENQPPGVVITSADTQPRVISEIKVQEVHITTTRNQQIGSTEVKATTSSDRKVLSEEELAATKIQAGIRGFLDRQKVKAIRAHKDQSGEAADGHREVISGQQQTGAGQQQTGPRITVEMVEEEWHLEEPHDPKLDAAATKIQASYKGYKTRKEIKTHHAD